MSAMSMGQITITTSLLHLPGSSAPRVRVVGLEASSGISGAHGREEVDVEGEDVKGEDEGDEPLENGGRIVLFGPVAGHEGDG